MPWSPLINSTLYRQGEGYLPVVLGNITSDQILARVSSATAPEHWRLGCWMRLLVDVVDPPATASGVGLESHSQKLVLNRSHLITNPFPDASCRLILEIPEWHSQLSIRVWGNVSLSLPSAIADGNIYLGRPVVLDQFGKLKTYFEPGHPNEIIGIAAQDAEHGERATYRMSGLIVAPDWTFSTGQTHLIAGAIYYLLVDDSNLSLSPYREENSDYGYQIMGVAIDANTLEVSIRGRTAV